MANKDDLKKEAASLGLSDEGSVADLEARIAAANEANVADVSAANVAAAEAEAPATTGEAVSEAPPLPDGATASPTEIAANALVSESEGAAEGAGDPEAAASLTGESKGKAKDSGSLAITRKNRTAWWCPFCDHSMTHTLQTCPKCGATRSGPDKATRK